MKRWALSSIALSIVIVIIFAISFISLHGAMVPTSILPTPMRQIVIDPGHGGEDGGAQVGNIVEKDINLSISKILADMMQEAGFEVILTRTEDISIYDESSTGLKNKKRSDIMNRLKIANDNPDAVMISIHQNKFPQSQYYGAQMFYGKQNKLSKPLAESLQSSIISMLQPDNTRKIKPITKSVYLVNNAKSPAVLCECGFLSNPAEAAKLTDPNYQKQLAFAIRSGILDFYNGDYTEES